MVPRHHITTRGPVIGFVCSLACLLIIPLVYSPSSAETADVLIVGEAFYMAGNLTEAEVYLSSSSASDTPAHAHRALYLLGRISLLKGDFRQAKEYFERSAEIDTGSAAGRWMALAGIGDTLYASGRYEEAIRRYRLAIMESGGGREMAVIDLKIALCEHALGRDTRALEQMHEALERIPVLSGWLGREEEFYYSMVMAGIAPAEPSVSRIFIVAGPLQGDFRIEEITGENVPVNERRDGSRTYLEFGPLSDPVQAMILSEKIRNRYAMTVEIIKR